MNVKNFFFLLILMLVSGVTTAIDIRAQVNAPDFEVDIVSARNEDGDGTRVDVFAMVPVTLVSFINTPDGFMAGYEIKLDAIELSDDNRLRNLVQSTIWESSIVVNTYAETQLDAEYDYTTKTILLDPGRYLFDFEVSDRNSNQIFLRTIPVTVRDIGSDVGISDITLLQSYDEESFTIVPRINGRIASDEGGFKVFYEVYSRSERDVVITQEVRRARENTIIPASILGVGGQSVDTDLAYSKEELVFLGPSRSQYIVTVPMDDFKVGLYEMRVTLEELGGEVLDVATRRFVVEWSGLSDHIRNIDDAIAQMDYAAGRRDLSFIRDAPNDVERYQRFRNFWKKRDPTPGTKRNERMEEYYYRIASANLNYGGTADGWKTDRGYVLVNFGEPDFVRRKSHSFDYEPYEVWEYQRIGRQFIFVDKTGFGDYELLVPIWDERTRLY